MARPNILFSQICISISPCNFPKGKAKTCIKHQILSFFTDFVCSFICTSVSRNKLTISSSISFVHSSDICIGVTIFITQPFRIMKHTQVNALIFVIFTVSIARTCVVTCYFLTFFRNWIKAIISIQCLLRESCSQILSTSI